MKFNLKCSVEGCESTNRVCRLKKGGNKPYCGKHQHHIQRYGEIKKITKHTPNEIIIKKNHAEIILRNSNQEKEATCLIDIEDVELIKGYKWFQKKGKWQGYVVANNKKGKIIRIHRLLLAAKKSQIVDHKNHNKLNNTKNNLRFVNTKLNSFNIPIQTNNTSGRVGVTFDKSRNKWAAQIGVNYSNKLLGRFDEMKDAVKARIKGEQKYFGEVIER